ncbi:MAG: SRPBCC domain-containing protein, partial [Chloroflexi bacterium]|nr:SRPBCC domain-containing protein [Chloroflexota bacterium]
HKTLFTGQHYFLIEPQAQSQVTFVQGEYFGGIMLPLMGAVLRKTVLGFDEMNHALKARVEAGS